jgi:diguanylate cyclase (GGDEF)-like protein
MSAFGRQCRAVIAGWILLGVFVTGTAVSAVPVDVDDPALLIKQAEASRTSDHARFLQLLNRLSEYGSLTSDQQQQLRYLQAWQAAYSGNYELADSLVENLLEKSRNETLRFRAGLFLVNSLGERSRYQEAFQRLSELLAKLPEIVDPDIRSQALATAAYLYEEAGQYDLALGYANQLTKQRAAPDDYTCIAAYTRLAALYKSAKLDGIEKQFRGGINECLNVGNNLYANGIRFYVASLAVQQGHLDKAIRLLNDSYSEVQRSGYVWLLSQFDALLAEAYWDNNQMPQATQAALRVIERAPGNSYAESLSSANKILYMVAKRQGDMQAALSYHEQYMKANEGYLDAVSRRALAYQVVQQQLLAKRLEVDTLSKQNEILQLQQTLDRKATETSRLYIILLTTVLAFIAFWAYRIKRSQLRFMKLARRDGLTGIYNRQHFVNEVELQLKYCRKSSREACLVLLDLDHFKTVNDTHGHAVGDRVLKRAVTACQAHLRSSDIFGRLGGEEFGIVLPDCTLQQVLARVELIRHAISTAAKGGEVPDVPISASFGVTSTTHVGYELRELLVAADDALYQAKREGRNRVSVSDDREKPCLSAVGVATAEGVR